MKIIIKEYLLCITIYNMIFENIQMGRLYNCSDTAIVTKITKICFCYNKKKIKY